MVQIESGVSAEYAPTDGEINNIVYLCCKYTAGWPMRQVDFQVCKMLAGQGTGPEYINKVVSTTCEYVWDHICGEPGEASPEKFAEHMKPMLEEWYKNSTPEERAKID